MTVTLSPLKHYPSNTLHFPPEFMSATLCLSGKAFNNTQAIRNAASNVISAIIFGKRFEYKDPVFQAMVKRVHESIHLTGSASILVKEHFTSWILHEQFTQKSNSLIVLTPMQNCGTFLGPLAALSLTTEENRVLL